MKKAIIAILINGMCLSFLGLFPFFKFQQYYTKAVLKQQIQSGIPLQQLTRLSFHLTDKIDWEETNKEFVFNSHRYDVVHQMIKGDSLIYYCFNDKEEATLVHQIEQYLAKQSNQKHQGSVANLFYKFLSQLSKDQQLINIKLFSKEYKNYFLFKADTLVVYLKRLNPPPEYI
jgi:hypothetical protein